MTILSEKIFNYIKIVDDTYMIEPFTPQTIKNQIKQFVKDFEKMYGQKLNVKYNWISFKFNHSKIKFTYLQINDFVIKYYQMEL